MPPERQPRKEVLADAFVVVMPFKGAVLESGHLGETYGKPVHASTAVGRLIRFG